MSIQMSEKWSPSDKAVAKSAVERARRRAEEEAIALHRAYKINGIEDLWALELKIREWRKDRQHRFYLDFKIANKQLAEWLSRGWLHESDLTRMSPQRLHAIKANV